MSDVVRGFFGTSYLSLLISYLLLLTYYLPIPPFGEPGGLTYLHPMDFTNRVVWITGASGGIGEALAYAFAARGATLVLSARRAAALDRVKAACTGSPRVLVVPLDVAEHAALPGAAEAVERQLGRVDILVNNAGISQRGRVKDTRLSVDERIMAVNYLGAVALTKAVLPGMLARGAGHFVVISSVVGKFSSPLRSSYAASKHALHGFFDALRAEEHEQGIGVTIVCPGRIRTDISKNALAADGSTYGKMDEGQAQGIAPAMLAEKILQAVARNKAELYVGGKELLPIYFQRYVPWFWRWLVRRVKVV